MRIDTRTVDELICGDCGAQIIDFAYDRAISPETHYILESETFLINCDECGYLGPHVWN